MEVHTVYIYIYFFFSFARCVGRGRRPQRRRASLGARREERRLRRASEGGDRRRAATDPTDVHGRGGRRRGDAPTALCRPQDAHVAPPRRPKGSGAAASVRRHVRRPRVQRRRASHIRDEHGRRVGARGRKRVRQSVRERGVVHTPGGVTPTRDGPCFQRKQPLFHETCDKTGDLLHYALAPNASPTGRRRWTPCAKGPRRPWTWRCSASWTC
jgi:hypothetical protein